MVEKFQDPDERRRVLLRPTPEAKQARLAKVQSQVNNEPCSPLTHGDFQTFKRLVSELVDGTDRAFTLLAALGPRVQKKGRRVGRAGATSGSPP